MSLFCLCVVESVKQKREMVLYTQQIEMLAKHYHRGVKFFVDWYEPLFQCIQEDSLLINILDSPRSENCELLLLPDGWYNNGRTNRLSFRERMKFLQDISQVFNNGGYVVDFYLGQSGTYQDEFVNFTLKSENLINFLVNTVGVDGGNNGVHISVIP